MEKEKLKTLKEINLLDIIEYRRNNITAEEEIKKCLRAEAVKWVKEWEKLAIKNVHLRATKATYHGSIVAFRQFFNLTEENLE